jgi:hypothetical protein
MFGYDESEIFHKPMLTEPGIKYFLSQTLKQCHKFKTTQMNNIYNLGLFFIFIFICASILFLKYKGKPTEEEKQIKEQQKKTYILSKIQNFKESKLRAQQSLITGLPHWDNIHETLV